MDRGVRRARGLLRRAGGAPSRRGLVDLGALPGDEDGASPRDVGREVDRQSASRERVRVAPKPQRVEAFREIGPGRGRRRDGALEGFDARPQIGRQGILCARSFVRASEREHERGRGDSAHGKDGGRVETVSLQAAAPYSRSTSRVSHSAR